MSINDQTLYINSIFIQNNSARKLLHDMNFKWESPRCWHCVLRKFCTLLRTKCLAVSRERAICMSRNNVQLSIGIMISYWWPWTFPWVWSHERWSYIRYQFFQCTKNSHHKRRTRVSFHGLKQQSTSNGCNETREGDLFGEHHVKHDRNQISSQRKQYQFHCMFYTLTDDVQGYGHIQSGSWKITPDPFHLNFHSVAI